MRISVLLCMIACVTTLASAQTFAVASIKPNQPGTRGGEGMTRESISFGPATLSMENVTLRSCLRWAYGLADYEISGPAWLTVQRYDIRAKADAPVSPEQL